jgi:hypothetical protein
MDYDFSGWATRNNIECSDGRTIMKDAFKQNDGQKVPLVWNHQHNDPDEVLGHALLENREEGVYAYCKFNNTESGQTAKALVANGDIDKLSIYANRLKSQMNQVVHGCIREVSLVLAGANPGAYIDSVVMHGEGADAEEEVVIYTDEQISVDIKHSDEESEEETDDDKGGENVTEEKIINEGDNNMTNIEHSDTQSEEKTIGEVFDTLTPEQKTAVYAIIGQAIEDSEEDDSENNTKKEGEDNMKHNVFENDKNETSGYIAHSDQKAILDAAKKYGSFQEALEMYAEENSLSHADTETAAAGGFNQTADANGFSVNTLFPEYKEVRPGAPELITNDQGWISVVMKKVHKSPISRIRTSQVDIRNIDALRAKGYKKGDKKALVGNFNLVRRTTDPQTIYVKNALHRDDIIDITDFDYVQYLYNIDKMNLNEELALAIMLGDGREEGAEGKIEADKIRPIWLDDELYTLHVDLDVEAARKELQGTDTNAHFGENYIMAEAMINTVLYAREKYKGTGTPDYFCTPRMLNVMLLARDMNGRRIYNSKAELASALNVGDIYTAEQFEGKTRKDAKGNTKKLHGIIANLADYSLGATKGGEVTHFTQFDIDFNQQKSLLETRCSGALTRVYSAIAIEEVTEEAAG